VVLLWDDTHPALDLAPLAGRVHAQHGELPALDRGEAVDHLHRRRLAGSVRPQEAEADPGLNVEVDARDSDAVAIALRQPAGAHRLLRAGAVGPKPRCSGGRASLP